MDNNTEKIWELQVSKQIEINTDPQRRCYNGCHFKSKLVWTDWDTLLTRKDKKSLEDTMLAFQRANPTHKYRIQ